MLLSEVKEHLQITWDDENDELQRMIERGKARIDDLAGATFDYTKPGLAQELFLNYCRYSYNNALEYFEENFHREILRLQLKTGVELLAALDSLKIGDLSLDPDFNPRITSYTVSTTDDSNIISAEAISDEATVNISVNMSEHENGTAYEWVEGTNNVTVTVIRGNNSEIYDVTVNKT